MTDEPLVRHVSDTALWVAAYRANESERPDARFNDPFARRLAGERGARIGDGLPKARENEWAMVARTWLIDRLVLEEAARGADLVVNLAAGLDTRPYRLPLPPGLAWVEVDLPELLDYKEGILEREKPVCRLERLRLDLSEEAARRELFGRLGGRSRRVLVLTEGLLVYLKEEAVISLARDLAAAPGFERWILDLASPGLVRLMGRLMGRELARAPMMFGPEEGPAFFEPHGWSALEVHSMLKTGARLKRLPFWLRLAAWLPESDGRQGRRPWSGVALFKKRPS